MKTYSFDVYDTVVTRVVPKPVDIFLLLQRVALASGSFSANTTDSIYDARIYAEFAARRVSRKEDVVLNEIYAEMKRLLSLDTESTVLLMEMELDIERRCTAPIHGVVSCIHELKSKGARIIYISDMYLPSPFIGEILKEYGIYDGHDIVYVSGEVGFTKGTGRLFDFVLQKENLLPEDLIHTGDNPHSDKVVPRRKGICTDAGTVSCHASSHPTKSFSAIVRYLASVAVAKTRLELRYVR